MLVLYTLQDLLNGQMELNPMYCAFRIDLRIIIGQ